ncbi:hypothetical protein Q0Z83_049280 [Actinoplanes sichuanensis]|uniref:BTAD domain-containing putative transcriptional regulator n=1 Tax=Actinoplanes sichuanensis TaxID=512349 RepID=A0ABW4APW6_9ACTN|nr:BTAD domain-containing putative transcriptional regulator [Actinoplanes sichuanensis]BEL06737.1 hypothetical protein Q0Z83_049280 [Actinoplanes sichuanensis]
MLIGRVLGPTGIERDGTDAELGGPLPRRLIAALLAADGRPVSEDALADAVWGDRPPASPGVSLQAYVSRLRRGLGADALTRVGDGYRLTVDGTDAGRFTDEVRRGRELLGDGRPGEALRVFETGLGRWRGEAFQDLPQAYARTALTELHAVATEEYLAARLAIGDTTGVIAELEAAVEAGPYRERRWELLILALYRGARQAEAPAALRRVRARLTDELGIDPGPALQTLERQVLAQDPRLLLVARPSPPVRPLSLFLGRTTELAALTAMAGHRLVSLVGPAGAGKTRLAIEFAADEDPWFVRLADLTEPGRVPAATATAMGVRGTTADAIVTALGQSAGLLLLDNCEHVTAAVADLVLTLLARCPGLRVLATSREPLGVDGERLLPIGPLPGPDAVALLTDRITAVRPGWRPDDTETAQLDRLATALGGIPLALELAAARARAIGPGELLDSLHDRFPALGPVPRGALTPHQTLEAAVAWSVDPLPPADRALLLRLWPFEGGFPLAAVDDLERLSALISRSVVVADTTISPARYRLLEMVRAYCRDQDPQPSASRAAHAAWVRQLVEKQAPDVGGEHSAHAMRTLTRELPNLLAAIRHDLGAAPAAALRTAGRLQWFWHRGGHAGIALPLLRAALDTAPAAARSDRARAWLCSATLHTLVGDWTGAWQAHRAAGELLAPSASAASVSVSVSAFASASASAFASASASVSASGDDEIRLLRAQAAYYAALFHSAEGAFGRAVISAREAVAQARAIGADWFLPAASVALGAALAGDRQVEQGRRVLTRAAEEAIASHQNWTAALSRLRLARTLLVGDPDPARALTVLRPALACFTEEDDVSNTLVGLRTGALALALDGRPRDGAIVLAGADRCADRRGLDVTGPGLAAALTAALRGVDRAEAAEAAARLGEQQIRALIGPG